VMKLGSGRATPIDVRVIAATHRDLHALVAQGAFRADLYFRLNLLPIRLPALRERREDLPGLAQHLMARAAAQYGLARDAGQRVLAFLAPLFAHYAWPGNVRELENLLARAAIYLGDPAADLGQDARDIFPEFEQIHAAAPGGMRMAGSASASQPRPPVTREDVLQALARNGGNRAAASRELGIGRTTLWRLMKA